MIFQKLPNSYNDATKIPLSNHLAALNDETGETTISCLMCAISKCLGEMLFFFFNQIWFLEKASILGG